jgi:hypothetical protein
VRQGTQSPFYLLSDALKTMTKSKMETRLKIANQQQQQQGLLVIIVRFLVKKIVRLKIVNTAIKKYKINQWK